ncbi:hypothetical protein ACFP8W_23400, partial [Nocardioides hankookensis]
RCGTCQAPIVWLLLRGTSWRTFEPRPVDGRTHVGGRAHPVEGKYAWPSLRECTEDLMVRREITSTEAQAEAYDMPWYVQHDCPTTDTETEESNE